VVSGGRARSLESEREQGDVTWGAANNHQIVEKVLNYDLVIADLTHPNPNVYYELAIRQCSGKRYVQMAMHGCQLPFDVAQVRSVMFGLEIDHAEEGKAALLKQIRASEQDKEPVFNPVTQTQAMVKVEKSGDMTQRMVVSLLDSQSAVLGAVVELQRSMADLQSRFPPITLPSLGRYLMGDTWGRLPAKRVARRCLQSSEATRAVRGFSSRRCAKGRERQRVELTGICDGCRPQPLPYDVLFSSVRGQQTMRVIHSLDRSPIHLLHRASQAVEQAFATWSRGKVTPRQLVTLIAIEESEGLNQTQLMERTGIDRSTTSEMIRRLQRKGLIQRRRSSQDARAYTVKLTDEGRRLLRSVMPVAAGVDRSVLGALPTSERKPFMAALALIVDAMERPAS
jgi:MarR family transcriptional regulator, temperature-dependent positive regulator of motility